MEPRFLKRGNVVLSATQEIGNYASMEPRFLKRGNI